MRKQEELLRQQLELLAEQSKGAMEEDLSNLSNSMCEVYKLLTQSHAAFFANLIVGAYFFVGFLILIKKLFRSKS